MLCRLLFTRASIEYHGQQRQRANCRYQIQYQVKQKMDDPMLLSFQLTENTVKGQAQVQDEAEDGDKNHGDHKLHDAHMAPGNHAPVFQGNVAHVFDEGPGAPKGKHKGKDTADPGNKVLHPQLHDVSSKTNLQAFPDVRADDCRHT